MSKLSLNQKISVIISVLSLGIILVAGVGLFNLKKIGTVVDRITEVQFKSVTEAMSLKDSFHSQMIYERNYILFHHIPEKRANNAEQISKLDKAIRDLVAVRLTKSDADEVASLKSFLATYDTWVENDKAVQKVMSEEGGLEKALKLVSSVGRDTRLAGDKALDEISKNNEAQLAEQEVFTAKAISQALQVMMWGSLGAILAGVLLAFFTLKNLTQAINQVLAHLGDNAHQVNQAASQIATASEGLSQSTTEQASSLEETVATIEELTAMVKVNADNASAATKLAAGTQNSAEVGEKKILSLLDAMKIIDQDSKKIREITGVVDDIAFQTNLLALNAAVEAARAGDQGKGFAVVAEAVRGLALRSSEAAKDISNLINSSVERIQDGYIRVNESVTSLSEIVTSVKKVSGLNSEIATAAAEQSNGITQIGKAMNQLDAVTQGNAAASEEAAASSQELASQAQVLNTVVAELRRAIKGSESEKAA
jgi:methyl-accepting chemotaxis protein